jgi:antagonist of KipI
MSIKINKAGVLETFQDLGRRGFRRFGINPNGAMDRAATRLINLLLGNQEDEAVLEMHFPAAEILFEEEKLFALGGAGFEAHLNDGPVENWRLLRAGKDDVLRFKRKVSGSRCYLSVAGGFELDVWLGSPSTNLTAGTGGFEGRRLRTGDRINFKQTRRTKDEGQRTKNEFPSLELARSIIPLYSNAPTVRIIKGNEFEYLTALSEQKLFSRNFRIANASDRMGFRLEGEKLHLLSDRELLSTAVDFGTIQMLPDGQLIILMADHQTTGGYPRIAHIVEKDLPLVAQLGAGDSLGFHLITLSEAEALKMRFERDLSFLRTGISLRKGF